MGSLGEFLLLASDATRATNTALFSSWRVAFISFVKWAVGSAFFVWFLFVGLDLDDAKAEAVNWLFGVGAVIAGAVTVYVLTWLYNLWLAPYRLARKQTDTINTDLKASITELTDKLTAKLDELKVGLEKEIGSVSGRCGEIESREPERRQLARLIHIHRQIAQGTVLLQRQVGEGEAKAYLETACGLADSPGGMRDLDDRYGTNDDRTQRMVRAGLDMLERAENNAMRELRLA